MRGKSRVIDCTHYEREEQGDGLYMVLTMRGKSRAMDLTDLKNHMIAMERIWMAVKMWTRLMPT